MAEYLLKTPVKALRYYSYEMGKLREEFGKENFKSVCPYNSTDCCVEVLVDGKWSRLYAGGWVVATQTGALGLVSSEDFNRAYQEVNPAASEAKKERSLETWRSVQEDLASVRRDLVSMVDDRLLVAERLQDKVTAASGSPERSAQMITATTAKAHAGALDILLDDLRSVEGDLGQAVSALRS